MSPRSQGSRASTKPRRGALRSTASPRGLHRRPRLHWQTLEPGEVVTPAELEGDVVSVLVRLLEWAAHAGVDFESALRHARQVEAERTLGATR